MKIKKALIVLCLLLLGAGAKSQALYSFQSIRSHTIFFSIAWQGKIYFGTGYSYRTGTTQFQEVGFEYRAPIADFFSGKDFKVIAGVHNRFNASKWIVAAAFHLHFNRQVVDGTSYFWTDLAMLFLPGYQYARPLNDAPSGAVNFRAGYVPTLFTVTKSADGSKEIKGFTAHTFQGGLHLDFIVKRSVGIALNPFVANTWFKDGTTPFPSPFKWDVQGDFYFGPTW